MTLSQDGESIRLPYCKYLPTAVVFSNCKATRTRKWSSAQRRQIHQGLCGTSLLALPQSVYQWNSRVFELWNFASSGATPAPDCHLHAIKSAQTVRAVLILTKPRKMKPPKLCSYWPFPCRTSTKIAFSKQAAATITANSARPDSTRLLVHDILKLSLV